MTAELQTIRRRHRLPGIVAGATRADGVLTLAAAGVRRLGATDPVWTADRFHIGSNAKAITATMIARLVEDGLLQWTTRPVDVLPELDATVHERYRAVTLEQLLTHTAGVPAFTSGFAIAMLPDEIHHRGDRSPEAWRRAFALHLLGQPPKGRAGTFLYSNAGYTIAAVMAEAATEQSWESLLDERVFAPLHIDAGYGWPAAADAEQPWGHLGALLRGHRPHDPHDRYQLGPLLAPGGDISISMGAYLRFLQEHLRGLQGRDGLLPAAVMRNLHHPRGSYALGWLVQKETRVARRTAGRISAHEGSAGTFHALASVHHHQDLAIAVFVNAGSARAVRATHAAAARLGSMWLPGRP